MTPQTDTFHTIWGDESDRRHPKRHMKKREFQRADGGVGNRAELPRHGRGHWFESSIAHGQEPLRLQGFLSFVGLTCLSVSAIWAHWGHIRFYWKILGVTLVTPVTPMTRGLLQRCESSLRCAVEVSSGHSPDLRRLHDLCAGRQFAGMSYPPAATGFVCSCSMLPSRNPPHIQHRPPGGCPVRGRPYCRICASCRFGSCLALFAKALFRVSPV